MRAQVHELEGLFGTISRTSSGRCGPESGHRLIVSDEGYEPERGICRRIHRRHKLRKHIFLREPRPDCAQVLLRRQCPLDWRNRGNQLRDDIRLLELRTDFIAVLRFAAETGQSRHKARRHCRRLPSQASAGRPGGGVGEQRLRLLFGRHPGLPDWRNHGRRLQGSREGLRQQGQFERRVRRCGEDRGGAGVECRRNCRIHQGRRQFLRQFRFRHHGGHPSDDGRRNLRNAS